MRPSTLAAAEALMKDSRHDAIVGPSLDPPAVHMAMAHAWHARTLN